MESFLICENPRCRMVLDLRENGHVLPRSEIVVHECPECGSPWSSTCPFCTKPLEVDWPDGLPHCSDCRQKFQAEVASSNLMQGRRPDLRGSREGRLDIATQRHSPTARSQREREAPRN
jgi:transcription elongation factor Elf1